MAKIAHGDVRGGSQSLTNTCQLDACSWAQTSAAPLEPQSMDEMAREGCLGWAG